MQTMLKSIRDRRENEEGFTLIELMVVVLIIAILIAIAIPTFLGARTKANDRAAQSSLRNALTAAKSVFTDQNSYVPAVATALQADEPSLTFGTAPSTDAKTVSVVAAPTASIWTAAALSKSNECFYIQDNSGAGGNGTTFAKVGSGGQGGSCSAGTLPATFSANGW